MLRPSMPASRTVWRVLATGLLVACVLKQPVAAAETVSFTSGSKTLHGLLYKPTGRGPFPTVLYNHGSAPGLLNNQAFDLIAPHFTAHGWAIEDEIEAAHKRGGLPLAVETMVRLLSTEQLQDQMAALTWLKQQPFVKPSQIAAMGNSFGGIETVLGVAHGSYCAGVDASGAAESWDTAPELQNLMLDAVRHAKAPILFFQAENDHTLEPSRTLHAAMEATHKPADIRIYAPYGNTPQDGHSFAYRGADIWFDDVFHFITAHCTS